MKANTKEGSSPLTLQQAADSDATLSYWKLYRWATTGLLGVKLRTWFVGATRYTTSDDIAEFNKAQNRLRNCSNAIAPSALKKRSRRARRQAKAEFGI